MKNNKESAWIEMRQSNLALALHHAIQGREPWEKKEGYTSDSALLAGWKEILKAIDEGRYVEIIT